MTRKPAYDTATFLFDAPVAVDAVHMHPDGTIEMLAGGAVLQPREVRAGKHRPRQGHREKPLVSIPSVQGGATMHEAQTLAQYRFIFAVDTNSRVISGQTVSFASIAVCSLRPDPTRDGIAVLQTVHIGGYEFRGMADRQERLAWVLLQDAIRGSPDFDREARYLILTDHDLKQHSAINAGQAPLFDDVMLLDGLTLGYATSDSGNSIAQKILRGCDRNSGRFLRDIAAGVVGDAGLMPLARGPITHFRGVQNTAPALRTHPAGFRLNTATPFLDRYSTE